jgi:glyoxylase-like metal-dependent hydrolase (beta-lactamase superfamily II)
LNRNWPATATLILLLTGNVLAQDAKTVISTASKAMGGDSLRTIEYSGTGAEYVFGQAFNPSSGWPAWDEKSYTRTIDYEAPAWRVDRVLTDPTNPTRRGGGLALGATQTVVVNANTPWANQVDLWMTPHGFLKAAATNNATVKSRKIKGKNYSVVTFMGPNKASVSGYINDQNMVERVETWIDNPMLGDTLLDVDYSDYKDYGGVKFPGKIVQAEGGAPILNLTVTSVKPNAPAGIQAPQRGGGGGRGGAAGGGPGGGGGDGPAMSQKLADGVYLIGPFLPTYASLVVEFKDYIVVIEAPQSEARANAIMTEAKRVIPNKPIKYVVATHAHFDHSSGIRAFMADGVTIITHKVYKPYYQKIATMPHTLNPDKESQVKRSPVFETMEEKKVLTDGNHVIELYRLQASNHADGLLVAYLPKEKILVEADGFNPPAQANAAPPNPPNPNQVNLLENIDRLKLDVETIIPVHYPADGRRVTKADLIRFVGKRSE